jgi:methionyl-tRNA synthetase
MNENDVPEGTGQIGIEDFAKLDLRVAKVVEASTIEGADRLLRLQIDVGGESRQLVAGIKGKNIIVVFNLKPARLRGVESQGMLLAAQTEDGPVLATIARDVPSGSRVK